MFGYVKPATAELKMREYDVYRAVYCGICKSAGGSLGCVAKLALTYDSVFLAALRMLASGASPVVKEGRCLLHPFRKRKICADCNELRYAAAATAILTDAKVRDDIRDERFGGRLLARLASPFTRTSAKRALRAGGQTAAKLKEEIDAALSRLSSLEDEGSPSLDLAAETFGELTAAVFSAGIDGDAGRILSEAGRSTGRFIYAADAADDAVRDAKTGNYNPILLSWSERAIVRDGKKIRLSPAVCEALLRGAMLDLGRLPPAIELLCDGGDPELTAIVKNITYIGMPAEANRIVSKNSAITSSKVVKNRE